MVELEQNIIPTLSKDISLWIRYMDDTIFFVNSICINHVLEPLNSFHGNIKFTNEIEKGNKTTSTQPLNTKIFTLHGLFIKLLHKLNKLRNTQPIQLMEMKTATRKYIAFCYHIKKMKVII